MCNTHFPVAAEKKCYPCNNTDKGGIADCQTCSKTEETGTCSACTALRPLLARGHQSRRNRTVCSPTQGSLRSIQCTRRRSVSEAASRHSPRDCPGAHATTERHTPGEQPDEYDPHPRQRAENDPQRDSHTRQPATTAPPETPAATVHYLTKHGEEPPVLSRDPPSPPDMTERATLSLRTPQAGPSSTALDGVCVDASAPPGNTFCTKGSSGTCSACKGHRSSSRRVLPNGCF